MIVSLVLVLFMQDSSYENASLNMYDTQNAVQQTSLLEQTCQKSTATATTGLLKISKVCSILMPRFMSRKARISTWQCRLIFFDWLIR